MWQKANKWLPWDRERGRMKGLSRVLGNLLEVMEIFIILTVVMVTQMYTYIQFSCSVMSETLQPHEMQHTRPPCPSSTPGVYQNSYPLSWWCHPIISSFVIPFSPCPQSFWASGSWRDHLKNESVFHIRWPKYCSFSFNISPSNEHSGLISFRMVGTPCSPSGD